jgi:four helix bundle protein
MPCPDGAIRDWWNTLSRMASGVRDLKVWQEAVLLGGEVVRAMRQGSRREIKAFTDHVMHHAVAVASNIAEGYGHYTNAEQRWYFLEAKRSLVTLETQLAIARQAGLISPASLASLAGKIAGVSRLLIGYISYIERQITAEQEASQPVRGAANLGMIAPVASSQLADRAPQ